MKTEHDEDYVKRFFRSGAYFNIFEPEECSNKKLSAIQTQERLDIPEITKPKGKTVLDVGTGKGRLAISFALAGAKRVTAVDLSEDILRIAEENTRAAGVSGIVSFELGDVENLKYRDELFDIVCSIDTFLYLPHPQKGMNVLGRVCKRGGIVVVNIGNANYHYFTEKVQSLLAKSSIAYVLVTGVYYSRLFSPVRKKLA